MRTFEEYKQAFTDAYGVEDEETLRLAYIIDERMEEAKDILGSANKGTGYWIAERLIQKGYQDAVKVQKNVAKVLAKRVLEEFDESIAIARSNIECLVESLFGVVIYKDDLRKRIE